jgi:hypothetical protein
MKGAGTGLNIHSDKETYNFGGKVLPSTGKSVTKLGKSVTEYGEKCYRSKLQVDNNQRVTRFSAFPYIS